MKMQHFLNHRSPEPNDNVLVECGCCGAYHPYTFIGDCRDDENRFNDEEEYSEKSGIPLEQIQVWPLDED